jgi:CheY-like chemotaxis protein
LPTLLVVPTGIGCAVGGYAGDALPAARLLAAASGCLITDIRMPGMDGPAATRAIRSAGDRTPIVALTANAFEEDRRACLEAGMSDHLVKPLDLEALRAALARWTTGDFRAKVASA